MAHGEIIFSPICITLYMQLCACTYSRENYFPSTVPACWVKGVQRFFWDTPVREKHPWRFVWQKNTGCRLLLGIKQLFLLMRTYFARLLELLPHRCVR